MSGILETILKERLLTVRNPSEALVQRDRFGEFDCVLVAQDALGDSSGGRGQLRRALFGAGFLPLDEKVPGLGKGGLCYMRSALLTSRSQAGVPSAVDGVSMARLAHRGRFGNQMFQYAFLRLYALRNHLIAKTPEWRGCEVFCFSDDRASANEYPDIFLDSFEDDDLALWDEETPPINVNFDGPFQEIPKSWRAHRHFLRLLFAPTTQWGDALAVLRKRLRDDDRTLVTLHVRRGDYARLTAEIPGTPFQTVPLEWYGAVLEQVWPGLRNPVLHVATDGGAEVKAFFAAWPQLEPDALPAEMPADFADFFLLREAKVALICNSSFSRMAALVADDDQQVFLPDFASASFKPYDPWDDRAFWARFHPSGQNWEADPVARLRLSNMRLRQALGRERHRPSGSMRPITSAEPISCRACGGNAVLHSVLDFNMRDVGVGQALSGAPVYYRRCSSCGFIFTDAFDSWQPFEFQRHVYNEDFFIEDPGFLLERPARRAVELAEFFPARGRLSILDFGGLNHQTAKGLVASGFLRVGCIDVLGSGQPRAEGKFDIVSCCDLLERAPNVREVMHELSSHVDDGGVIICATLMQDHSGRTFGPRQGHIAQFSPAAIVALWKAIGFHTALLGRDWHIAFRDMPDFAKHLVARQGL